MSTAYDYSINKDIKFPHLERIDVPELVKQNKEKWFNQTLTQVNESVVRLGIVEGEYHGTNMTTMINFSLYSKASY